MRRVIVDQIEALAELNRIVARHGRALDAAEPVRPEPALCGGRRPAAEPRASASDPAGSAPPPAQPPQAGLRDITGAPARRPGSGPAEPGHMRRPRPDHAPAAPAGGRAGNGRTAAAGSPTCSAAPSRDESAADRAVTARTGARDEIVSRADAVDFARYALGRHRAHDRSRRGGRLWERYKRGERGVFTPASLHHARPEGVRRDPQEIPDRPEFRLTVDHYIDEFERLLDDVSRGDRGPTVARNYLTSDTGKVYTMLAHAAGRFD